MQEIIQWLNNNSNQDFSNFRLLEVEHYENFNKTIFKFHYNGETFVDESKKELKKVVSSAKTSYLCIRLTAHKVDSLAQQVEHIPFKDGVLGSSPKRIT